MELKKALDNFYIYEKKSNFHKADISLKESIENCLFFM